MKCCCLSKTQKCPKYFCEPMVCNKWTGVVLKVWILSLEWWIIYLKYKKSRRRMYHFVGFKCDWKWMEAARTPFDLWNEKKSLWVSNVWFCSAPFCLFLKLHVHIVLWSGEHVLGGAVRRVGASLVDHSVAWICSACPLLFCTLSLLCAMFYKYLDYIQDMPF